MGLGQRLAKIRKGRFRGSRAAVARKIFEAIDRKAAEPKTRKERTKGATRARHLEAQQLTLTPDEKKILASPHEILLIHSPDGRLKSVTKGTRDHVTIPIDLAAGAILSHNHPSGRGPSDADIKAVLSFPGITLRVVGKNETGRIEIFSLKFTGHLSAPDIEAFTALHCEHCLRSGDTHAGRRQSLALISEIIGDSFHAESRIFP